MNQLERVIEGCRNGDEASQRELYEQYSPRFYALCRRYVADDVEAQEVLMEGFISIFNSMANYRGEGSFEGWMKTIFMRQIYKVYSRERRHRYQTLDSEEMKLVSHVEDHGQRMDVRNAFIHALRSLTADQRMLFNMIAIEEYSLTEVSKMHKVPVSTLKSRYYQARDLMRKKMEKYLK